MDTTRLKTAQIGRCGELLVQYRLLKFGIESAPLTTDSGIDLVAYAPRCERPVTIQVKANRGPKPGGGKGRLALDWWLPVSNPADLVALVDLTAEDVWLLKHSEFDQLAQQRPDNGKLHLYFYVDDDYQPRRGSRADEFETFKLERRIEELFGKVAVHSHEALLA